jgi:hypothetical protein
MMTLAEKLTRENGGDWRGTFGEIADVERGPDDRSIILTDRADGSITVFLTHGGNSGAVRAKLVEARRRRLRALFAARKADSRSPGQIITLARGGDWNGRSGRFPAIGRSPDDRSVSIEDHPTGGITLRMMDGSDWRFEKNLLRRDGLLIDRFKNRIGLRSAAARIALGDVA